MAAIAELARPGVEVIQSIRTVSPTFLRPTLAPVIVGPAFEVVDVLTADGTVNSKAQYGSLTQFGKTITQLSFPNPRSNIDELNVDEASIKPYLFTGGKLRELPMDPGDGFLQASHVSSGAVFKVAGDSFALNGLTLIIAVDQPVRASSDQDVTVTFTGTNPFTATQTVAAINAAFGYSLAALTYDTAVPPAVTGFAIVSPTRGAGSSLTVRGGGTANSILGIGYFSAANVEERIEASGYRAYDLNDNNQFSTWVEFFRGDFLRGGVSVEAGAWATTAFLRYTIDSSDVNARHAVVEFGSGASQIPILVGDQMYADGAVVKGSEISRVEQSRFRLGTINPTLSVADENGNYTSKVYDSIALGLVKYANAFEPKYVWFKANGLLSTGTPTPASMVGTLAATPATAAVVLAQEAPPTLPINLQGLTIDYSVTVNSVVTTGTFTFTEAADYTSAADIAADIVIPGVVVDVSALALQFTTSATGQNQAISILNTGTANAAIGITAALSDTGTDDVFTGLSGTTLDVSFDDGAHVYSVTFIEDSLDVGIVALNTLAGATVATKDGTHHLVLTSPLAGVASKVTIVAGDATTILGFTVGQTSDTGTKGAGRPLPDAYLDGSNNLVIGSDLVRDPVTGYPLDFATSPAYLYIQFKALRLDVSPLAKTAGVLRLPDTTTLSQVLDPVDERNPLALGLYLAMLNCPTFEVKGLGVDETSASAPEGTELAYARAASFLEAEEVYAVVPLSQNDVVHQTFTTHVTLMSQPEMGGERIVFFNKDTPSYATPAAVASGAATSATATANQLQLDVTPQQGLVEAGVDPNQNPIPASDGVYVELTWEGVFYRYNVSRVSGGLANLRVSFAAGENDDLFYSTVTLPPEVLNASWAMKVRGAELLIPGSTMPDYSSIADTVAEGNAGIANRRAFSLFPDTVKTTLEGIEKSIPGYYACACVAGMVAGLPPQQGHTNYPITGLTGVVGTDNYTRRQLNKMAGGGTFILMQEVQNGPVFSRHQVSTDTTSVETRELSITKVVDFVAKFLRAGVRRFIGRQNINSVFLDTVGTTIQAMLTFLTELGVINGANLNNIIQDEKNPDTVMVDVTLDVPFPCNYIRLTLVV